MDYMLDIHDLLDSSIFIWRNTRTGITGLYIISIDFTYT